MPNYSFFIKQGKSLPSVDNGHVFEMYNFSQMEPHTKIYEGVENLTFRKCNLCNCDVPADAIVEDCLTIHKEFCSNIHPYWVSKGLTECIENCAHVIDTDTVTIDSQVVDTIYHYEDTIS